MFRSLWAGLSRGRLREFGCDSTPPFGDDEMVREILGEIQTEWRCGSRAVAPESVDLIDLALRRMQRDLQSGRCTEVIEELQREIAYRFWCARADPLKEDGSSLSPLPRSRPTI